jgi:MFS-type transporter involved in bile tolerance (Atg22 family)
MRKAIYTLSELAFAMLVTTFVFSVVFGVAAHADGSIADKIPEPGSATGIMLQTGIAIAFDMITRLFKTKKPLSLAWSLVGILKKLVAVGIVIVAVAEKGAKLLDAILPQNVAEPAPVTPIVAAPAPEQPKA